MVGSALIVEGDDKWVTQRINQVYWLRHGRWHPSIRGRVRGGSDDCFILLCS